MHISYLGSFLVTATLFAALSASAQKLPNKQEEGLWAPANIKIDGDANEWDYTYKAYNRGVEFFYAISNDSDNLYLVIHASRDRIIEKIIEGGITFTVNNSGKKDDKSGFSLLYPNMPLPIGKGALVAAGKIITGKTMEANSGPIAPGPIMPRPVSLKDRPNDLTASLDSAAKANKGQPLTKANNQLAENLKVFKITGFDVTDTLVGITPNAAYYRTLPLHAHQFQIIKVDNQDNIRAMMQFDKAGELTYELAMPLKYIKAISGGKLQFYYNLTVNARGEDGRPGNTWQYNPPGTEPRVKDIDMEEPTDFWAKYVLAKAP